MRRASPRGSMEAAWEDTAPADGGHADECTDAEDDQRRKEGRGNPAVMARETADRARLDEVTADADRPGTGRDGLLNGLLLGGARRSGCRARPAARRRTAAAGRPIVRATSAAR